MVCTVVGIGLRFAWIHSMLESCPNGAPGICGGVLHGFPLRPSFCAGVCLCGSFVRCGLTSGISSPLSWSRAKTWLRRARVRSCWRHLVLLGGANRARPAPFPAERVAKFGAINVEELVKQVAAPKRKSRFDKLRVPAVAPAAPLEDMVVDTDEAEDGEVGQKRRRPEQGGRDGGDGGDSAGSTSQPSSKCVSLPAGAKAHSNPGGGDCLFYCLADVLSGVQNKTRGHRQVRAGVVAWMEKHTELLEQHWDHLGPDGEYMQGSFRDYLKAVRRSGAWAGWLELYAAGVAEDLNILILSPDGAVRFAARNEVGHFAVLKYECGHYEVLTMDQKSIAELWLAASDAKPSGGRAGAGW